MAKLLDSYGRGFRQKVAEAVALTGYTADNGIPEDMTFRQWCEDLARRGMKIDGKPFSLDNRQALIPIYDAIPSTREEAKGRILVVQKATQLGLTVWEVLAMIYMAIKFGPATIGMFLPDQSTAAFKSEHRFMRIVRSVPQLLRRLIYRDDGEGGEVRIGEGNVLTRVMGESIFLFLWTTGKVTTESRPMDIVGLDEVQEMDLAHIDKVMARMGDSDIGFALLLSTANMPDQDINYWYQLGTQEVWHTRCGACGAESDLSDPAGVFPDRSIKYERSQYRWACPACGGTIEDPQVGRYIPSDKSEENRRRLRELRAQAESEDGEARDDEDGGRDDYEDLEIISFLIPRTVSPKITPRKMFTSWHRAKTGDQKKSFYNRTLARPYIDANQLPVTMAHCEAAAKAGMAAGLTWKTRARGTYMGIDQMGSFNVVIIKERLQDGRQGVIHVEAIFDDDPFARCTVLMAQYGVAVCVVEQLPNVNDARRFANYDRDGVSHRGRVFLAGYADLKDDMMVWGDTLARSDKKTAEEDRSRYSVTLHQYKAMQTALYRIRGDMVNGKQVPMCLFPDPGALEQDVIEGGKIKRIPILRDWVFKHFTKTALVVEDDEETRKKKAKVMKVGIDPHFAYANMLCDVAWARVHGAGTFFMPETTREEKALQQMQNLPTMPPAIAEAIAESIEVSSSGDCCGNCSGRDVDRPNWCNERGLMVKRADPPCPLFVRSRG